MVCRRLQGDRAGTKTQFGHPRGLAGAARQLQALLGQQRRLGQCRPDMSLRTFYSPIPRCTYQQIHAQSLSLVKVLIHIGFAIGHTHQPRCGQLLAQLRQRLHAVKPLVTFLLLDGSPGSGALRRRFFGSLAQTRKPNTPKGKPSGVKARVPWHSNPHPSLSFIGPSPSVARCPE